MPSQRSPRLPDASPSGLGYASTFAVVAGALHGVARPVVYLLTLVDSESAGRAYAAYGGVYIVSSFLWLWLAKGHRLDRWNVGGAAIRLLGAGVILLGPRGT